MGGLSLERPTQQLAYEIVKDHFGDVVAKTCENLLKRGRQTLGDIVRGVELPPGQVKQSLLILIQHNCVNSYLPEVDADAVRAPPANPGSIYEADTPRIVQRLRHPKFLLRVREGVGEREEVVVQALLEHGRLRTEQLLEYTASREGRQLDEARADVEEALVRLVQARYVERAPLKDVQAPKRSGSSSSKAAGRDQASKAEAEAKAAHQYAQQARASSEKFRLPASLQQVATLLGKRKRGEARVESAFQHLVPSDSERDSGVLWRVNHHEFNRRARHEVCCDLVGKKMEPAAAAVLAAVLRVSCEHEISATEERTVPVSSMEIRSAMGDMIAEGRLAVEKDLVVPVLNILLADPSELISKVGEMPDGGMTVSANLKRMVDLVRLKAVEGVIKDRYGAPACRVFRLLTLKRQLEQKQVAENAMLPMKDTREVLYRLLKAGYVSLQEVARTADHNPQRTFYLWRVDAQRVAARLAQELAQATVNVHHRLSHELQAQAEVMGLLEKVSNRQVTGSGTRVALTVQQRGQLERVRRVAAILETRLMHLDEELFLFLDA